MIHALSDAGLRALRDAASQPLLYAFDFDGTLAPISNDRHSVTVPAGILRWLSELAKRASCAIVSGRALADVAFRVNGYIPHVIGNHGIESPLTSSNVLLDAERTCAGWKQQMRNSLGSLTALGVEMEDKRYTLTVHLRGARNPTEAAVNAIAALRQLTPMPELIEGKYSINALPPGQTGKGPATLALMRHLGRTGLFFMGDEATDESVFSLVQGVAMGVHVGRQENSHAKFYLQNQAEVEELLRVLVEYMRHESSNPRPAG